MWGAAWPWRVADIVMAGVFVLSAAVQLNDPDPVRWVVVYALGAVVSAVPLVWSGVLWLGVPLAGITLLWSLSLVPAAAELSRWSMLTEQMQATTPAIEAAREFLGAAMVSGWSGLRVLRHRARREFR